MTTTQVKLAKLSVKIFEADPKCDEDVTLASKEIFELYSTVSRVDHMLGELHQHNVNIRDEWNEFTHEVDSFAPDFPTYTEFDRTDLGRKICWKKIQLISNELRHLAVTLRECYPNSGPTRYSNASLIEIERVRRRLRDELRRLQRQRPAQPTTGPTNENPNPNPNPNPTVPQDANAQLRQLQTDLDLADSLVAQHNWPRAESVSSGVRDTAKRLYGENDVIFQNAHKILCVSLRHQRSSSKLQRARNLYWEMWNRPDALSRAARGDSWVLDNGFGLAQVLEEQGHRRDAEDQYGRLWEFKPEAALQYARLLIRRNEPEFSRARRALKRSFRSGDADIRTEATTLAFQVGRSLYEAQRFDAAEEPLQLAWTESKNRHQRVTSTAFSGGWCLSRVYYSQDKWDQTKNILDDLKRSGQASSSSEPSMLQIDAFLAWVQRKLGQNIAARALAEAVWSSCGERERNLLGSALSNGENLVWLLSNYSGPKDSARATRRTAIWEKVKEAKMANARSCTRADLEVTVRCWNTLADDVERFGRNRGARNVTTATKIRTAAATLSSIAATRP